MPAPVFVVVSGLPGSGKSTVAGPLARALRLVWIDKDAILEALFDALGVGDWDWRQRLSRASDDALFSIAASSPGAVLDNWWHHDSSPERLSRLPGQLVEVFCDCPPEVATARFHARTRHPGHLDPTLSLCEQADKADRLRRTFPGALRLGGPLISLDTSAHVDIPAVADEILAVTSFAAEVR